MENGDFSPTKDGSYYNAGNAFGKSVAFNFDNISTTESQKTKEQPIVENEETKKKKKAKIQSVIKNGMEKLSDWMDKFTFASVPIFAFFTFLFFRKTGYNYTENLAISAFMISITNIFGILLVPPSYLNPIYGGTVLTVITGVYSFYFMYRVFIVGTYSEVERGDKSNIKYQFHRFKRVVASSLKVASVFLLSYLVLSILMGMFLFLVLYGSMTEV